MPLFYPQGDPLGVLAGPKNQFYEDIIQNTFSKTGEKHKIHFIGLSVVFLLL